MPREHWKRGSICINRVEHAVKFLVVEIQLLLQGLEGDNGMHDDYVEMRNKLAN